MYVEMEHVLYVKQYLLGDSTRVSLAIYMYCTYMCLFNVYSCIYKFN